MPGSRVRFGAPRLEDGNQNSTALAAASHEAPAVARNPYGTRTMRWHSMRSHAYLELGGSV